MLQCNGCGKKTDTFVTGTIKHESMRFLLQKVTYCSSCVEKMYAALQQRYLAQPKKPEPLEQGEAWESPCDES